MTVNPVIRLKQRPAEIRGKSGTKGTRKPLLSSGCLFLSKITPIETNTNANKVPMLERSAASPISSRPAGNPTASPAIQVDQ